MRNDSLARLIGRFRVCAKQSTAKVMRKADTQCTGNTNFLLNLNQKKKRKKKKEQKVRYK